MASTGKPSHTKLFTTAVATFYQFAFGFDILNPGGSRDDMAYYLRQKAQAAAPKQLRPTQAEDMAKIRDGLCTAPPISEQSLPQLVETITVLSRTLGAADRPADLSATAFTESWANTRIDPDDDVPVTMCRYDTKTRKGQWHVFTILPIQKTHLTAALGWPRGRATDVINHCCLARAWKTYILMVRACVKANCTLRTLQGRKIYAESALLFVRTKLAAYPQNLRFIQTDRLSKIVRAFHLEYVGALPVGTKHVTYWWRHYVLSTLHAIGEPAEAMAAADHKSVRTFLKHYDVSPNPDFMERWRLLSKRRQFSVLPPRTKLLL